jgi:DNA-binding response OmpR family regulator
MVIPDRTILLIERAGKTELTFAPFLERKGFLLEIVSTGQQALERAGQFRPALVILNAASLGSTGLRICRQIRDRLNGVPLIHIMPEIDPSAPPAGEPIADVTLIMPFTARKLINRARGLMPASPDDQLIECGAIRLFPVIQVVHAHGREKRLTARAASLLEIFLKHPDEMLDRSFLMRQVWDTDYLGDTRTLDVHIRWVREAIEPDPRHPTHIVTVRGRGYRLSP